MKNKGIYKINTISCINQDEDHIWTRGKDELINMCLVCFQPKMVTIK